MLEEPLKLDYILEKSEVENVYQTFKSIFVKTPNSKSQKTEQKKGGFFSFFRHPISYIQSFFSKKDKEDIREESNFIIQWRRIFETIISIIKDDTSVLSDILAAYEETISLKTKNVFFEKF